MWPLFFHNSYNSLVQKVSDCFFFAFFSFYFSFWSHSWKSTQRLSRTNIQICIFFPESFAAAQIWRPPKPCNQNPRSSSDVFFFHRQILFTDIKGLSFPTARSPRWLISSVVLQERNLSPLELDWPITLNTIDMFMNCFVQATLLHNHFQAWQPNCLVDKWMIANLNSRLSYPFRIYFGLE